MNVHNLALGAIRSVNPTIPVEVRVSTGPAATAADGSQTPQYATPGSLTGSIAGNVLTVTVVASGLPLIGQLLAGGGVLAGTTITEVVSAARDGTGTYLISRGQTLSLATLTTTAPATAQVQPLSTRDLMQLEGINLGGVRWKVYLYGQTDAVVRPEKKGGDLIIIAAGRHQGTWLVVQVMEQFPDWACAAIVQQNGG